MSYTATCSTCGDLGTYDDQGYAQTVADDHNENNPGHHATVSAAADPASDPQTAQDPSQYDPSQYADPSQYDPSQYGDTGEPTDLDDDGSRIADDATYDDQQA